jgi:thiosulfate dehydrogenase
MHLRILFAGLAAATAIAVAACSGGGTRDLYDPQALPSGPVGASIAYGHDILVNTPKLMKSYVRADMACAACHLAAGTQPRGGSFVGIFGTFPQWNKRSHRVIALQDRIAECFLYSMNGRAPSYSGKAMIAIVAYIAWISRGRPTGKEQPAEYSYIEPLPTSSPDLQRGATTYMQKCAACHGADGQGISGVYPPLWGARSFNSGAGMAHIDRMTGFVYHNMPQNAPGSLSLTDAYDVAAFVLVHKRPHFQKTVLVTWPARPAKFF